MKRNSTNTSRTYGYCRISTKEQSIERQRTNNKRVYPEAILIEDEYTGTKIEGRGNGSFASAALRRPLFGFSGLFCLFNCKRVLSFTFPTL